MIAGASVHAATVTAWMSEIADSVAAERDYLTQLDAAIGDGDHGINMDRGFSAIVVQLDAGIPEAETDRSRAGTVLRTAGRTLISTVGGAAGPLYGTAFMRAGGAIMAADPETDAGQVVLTALEMGIGGITGLGKAAIGEKTMLDALVPARAAGQLALDSGGDVGAIIRAIADAADAGATATIPMLATKGRASYLGERSIGQQDPGATSSALLLRALADVVAAG
jgi:dihydroxyacetone kinase-like protein